MYIINKVLKMLLIFVIIMMILIPVLCGKSIFGAIEDQFAFLDNKNAVYINWHVRLPKEGKEIYYINSGASFNGDGEIYSVYKYSNRSNLNNDFNWQDKRDKNIEEEVFQVLERLREADGNIPKKYKIDFNKKYKYITKLEDDNSKLYLIYIVEEDRIYVLENII